MSILNFNEFINEGADTDSIVVFKSELSANDLKKIAQKFTNGATEKEKIDAIKEYFKAYQITAIQHRQKVPDGKAVIFDLVPENYKSKKIKQSKKYAAYRKYLNKEMSNLFGIDPNFMDDEPYTLFILYKEDL